MIGIISIFLALWDIASKSHLILLFMYFVRLTQANQWPFIPLNWESLTVILRVNCLENVLSKNVNTDLSHGLSSRPNLESKLY